MRRDAEVNGVLGSGDLSDGWQIPLRGIRAGEGELPKVQPLLLRPQHLSPEEAVALQGFLGFVQIDDEGDQYYPGFEIW